MNRYTVKIERRVLKELDDLEAADRDNVMAVITSLGANPRPAGCRKLKGRSGYRIRVGDYRIIYDIFDEELVVLIVKVGHRKDVYRK